MAAPAVLPKLLMYQTPAGDGMLTAAGNTIYTAPAATTGARVVLIRLTNIDASPHTFSIWSHSTNGAVSMTDAHVLYKDKAIAAGETILLPVPFVVGSTLGGAAIGHLMAAADANSFIEIAVFGAEQDTLHADVGRSLAYESFQGVLTTTPSAAVLMTQTSPTLHEVAMSLILCNVDSSAHTVTIQFSADNFSGLHTTRIISVPADDTVTVEDQVILSGVGIGNEFLTAFADANSFITATMSAVRVDVA